MTCSVFDGFRGSGFAERSPGKRTPKSSPKRQGVFPSVPEALELPQARGTRAVGGSPLVC